MEAEPIALEELAVTESPRSAPAGVAGAPLLGEVIGTEHPTRAGCALVQAGADAARWMPALQGLSLQAGDRVLFVQPGNAIEPVIVGVLDGLVRAAPRAPTEGARVVLKEGESLAIASAEGKPLVELFQGERGPVVRLVEPDLDLELPGALRVRAGSIELAARQGQVRVSASDDVIVQGETIKLN